MFTGHDYAGADEYFVLNVYRDAVFVSSDYRRGLYSRGAEGTRHGMTPLVRNAHLTSSKADEMRFTRSALFTWVRSDPPRTRTENLLIKSQLLCQIELAGLVGAADAAMQF